MGRLRPKRLAEALLSGMRALHRAREGQKVVLLNDSERSLNLFFFFFFFFFNLCIEPVMDINSTYQYTKTFHLIDTTIKTLQ